LLAASSDGVIRQWDVKTGKVERSYEEHRRAVTALAMDPKRGRFFSAGLDHELFVHTLDQEKSTSRAITEEGDSPWLALDISPSGTTLALGGVSASGAFLKDAESGKRLRSLIGPKELGGGAVQALSFVDEKRLVARTRLGRIVVWDTATGDTLHSLDAGSGEWAGLAVSADGRYLASPLVPRVGTKTALIGR
jgi:WD40 repeat protein